MNVSRYVAFKKVRFATAASTLRNYNFQMSILSTPIQTSSREKIKSVEPCRRKFLASRLSNFRSDVQILTIKKNGIERRYKFIAHGDLGNISVNLFGKSEQDHQHDSERSLFGSCVRQLVFWTKALGRYLMATRVRKFGLLDFFWILSRYRSPLETSIFYDIRCNRLLLLLLFVGREYCWSSSGTVRVFDLSSMVSTCILMRFFSLLWSCLTPSQHMISLEYQEVKILGLRFNY